jgi:MFS family permease
VAAIVSDPPAIHLKRARLSVSVIFLVHGLIVATWVSRIPAVQSSLGLSKSVLGSVLLAVAAGSMISMPITGWLAGRYGSKRMTLAGSLLFCATLVLPGFANNAWTLAAALACFGAGAGAMDVSMNVQAVEVETAYDRPVMASFHALFSVGGMLGSAAGGAIAAAGIPPVVHFTVAALILVGMTIAAYPGMIAGARHEEHLHLPTFRISPHVLSLSALAFCIFLNEGAMADWSTVYLRSSLGTTEGVAAYGYAVFSGAMAIGRIVGDRLTMSLGRVEVVRYGASLGACGLGAALIVATVPGTLIGFAAAGLGFAAIIPLVFGAAGRVEGQSAGSGLATVTTIGYLGFLAGPPVIGFLADLLTLRVALGLLVLLSASGAYLAGAVRPSRNV